MDINDDQSPGGVKIRFKSLTPMLHTEDLSGTIAWYEGVLGFRCTGKQGDDWCQLERDGVAIMFMCNAHFETSHATATQYFQVEDVMELWNAVEKHCTAEWGPEQFAYGMLEFAIKDPNGYLLSFGQPVSG